MAVEKITFQDTNFLTYLNAVASSAHANYPVSNLNDNDHNVKWRSNYGVGSGWGTFEITASNRYLDFNEGGSELTATLTLGTYDADTLGTEIETRMDAAGANTYTVEIVESGGYFLHWKIARATGSNAVNLLCSTGTNKANSVYGSIGYSDSADRTGATTYYSDTRACHTHESLTWDLGAAQNNRLFAIKANNIPSNKTAKIQFSADYFATAPAVDQALTYCGGNIWAYLWSSNQSYRYARLWLEYPTAPYGYVEVGYPSLSGVVEPAYSFKNDYFMEPIDKDIKTETPAGHISGVYNPYYVNYNLTLREKGKLPVRAVRAIWSTYRETNPVFIILDPGTEFANNIGYFNIVEWAERCIRFDTFHYEFNFTIREAT